MKAFVEYVARGLVQDPAQVSVEESVGPRSSVVRLHVGPKDMGRVIGREGRIANAIRTLLKVPGAREDRRYTLEIE